MPVTIGAKRESNFTDPIGMLGDCHGRIVRFLQVLVTLSSRVNGGPLNSEQRSALATSLLYFREAAPKHTADEEESLFPRLRLLRKPEIAALLAKVDSLEEDHVCADRHHAEVDRLGQLWLQQGQLSSEEAERFSVLVNQLSELYRHHIGIEDREVFPFAAAALAAEDREAIGAEMAARRGLGNGKPPEDQARTSTVAAPR
ncbi:MAG: hemerythrin domain-containing protein [Bryobacterales bacterium]|nr:hemerythrin domain-containing protein [Bryobacterales bacterium]